MRCLGAATPIVKLIKLVHRPIWSGPDGILARRCLVDDVKPDRRVLWNVGGSIGIGDWPCCAESADVITRRNKVQADFEMASAVCRRAHFLETSQIIGMFHGCIFRRGSLKLEM